MKKLVLYFILLFSLASGEAQHTFIVMPSAEIPINNDVLQFKLNKWRPRSMAELAADLNLAISGFDTTYIYAAVNSRVRYVDTSAMFSTYRTALNARVNYADTAALFAAYRTAINARVQWADTATLQTDYRAALLARIRWTDTSSLFTDYRTAINARSVIGHVHVIGDVTGLQAAIDGKQATLVSGVNIKTINTLDITGPGDITISGGGGGGTWGSIAGTLADQTDLQAALDAKQALNTHLTSISGLTPVNDNILQYKSDAWTHRTITQYKTDLNYIIADLPGLQAAIDGKAAIDNPTFTTLITTPLIKITGGSPGAGKVFTSDADGDGTWETPSGGTWATITGALSSNATLQAALDLKADINAQHHTGITWLDTLKLTGTTAPGYMPVDELGDGVLKLKSISIPIPVGVYNDIEVFAVNDWRITDVAKTTLWTEAAELKNKEINGDSNTISNLRASMFAAGEMQDIDVTGLILKSMAIPTATVDAATLSSEKIAGRNITGEVSDNGVTRKFATHPSSMRVRTFGYAGGTATSYNYGLAAGTPTGTVTGPNPASTNIFTQRGRGTNTSAAGAGSYAIWRGNGPQFMIHSTAGWGGFTISQDFGISVYQAGGPVFSGLYVSGGSATPGNPGSYVNCVGLGKDDTATTLKIIHNDASGVATQVYLGADFPGNTSAADWYTLYLHAAPGQNTAIGWRVVRETTGSSTIYTAEGTITTNIPASGTLLYWVSGIGNGATAAACAVDMTQIVVETKR